MPLPVKATGSPVPTDDFVAMAAHELRGPATVIVGAAETLQRLVDPGELSADAAVLLALLLRSARHLRKVTVDVLSSVYLERGELPSTVETLPLLPIIRWAVDAGGSDAGAVHVDCDPERSADVHPAHL